MLDFFFPKDFTNLLQRFHLCKYYLFIFKLGADSARQKAEAGPLSINRVWASDLPMSSCISSRISSLPLFLQSLSTAREELSAERGSALATCLSEVSDSTLQRVCPLLLGNCC